MVVRARVAAVEFDGDDVRLAVVKTGGRVPKVLELHAARAVYNAPEGRFEARVAAVKEVFKAVKRRPSVIVLCVSSTYAMVRTLTIPFRGARKVASAVRFELEPYLAFPIEDLAVDFSPVLEADGQTDVLAVGVRRTILQEQLDVLSAAGIEAESADVDAIGMTGFWRAVQPKLKGLHAVLHVRDDSSILAVTCNKTLAYYRHLTFGAASLRRSPGAAAREVLNSMRAFQSAWRGEGEITNLCLTGEVPDALSPEGETFEKYFDIPLVRLNLLDALKATDLANGVVVHEVFGSEASPVAEETPVAEASPEEGSGEESEASGDPFALQESEPLETPVRSSNLWEAIIGVALGAAGGGYSLNFREGDLAPKNAFGNMASQVMATSCLALLLLAGVAWYYYYARVQNLRECETLNGQIEELQKEVDTLKEKGIDIPPETFSDPSLLDILSEIATKMPDSKVSLLELKIDRGTVSDAAAAGGAKRVPAWITLRGEVKDDNTFTQIVADLKKSDMFQVDEPDLKLDGGKSTFKIVAHRKGAAQ